MNNRHLQSPVLPLYSNEAEQSVLGGLMLENDRWDDIEPILSVNDFSSSTHRLLFTEMARLISAGLPIDLITLTNSLEKQSRLDQVGGFAYVAELSKNTPSAANIEAYSRIVADYSRYQPRGRGASGRHCRGD
jgi:replicative DNA helicase